MASPVTNTVTLWYSTCARCRSRLRRVSADGGWGWSRPAASSPPAFQANWARERSSANNSISASPASAGGSVNLVSRTVLSVMTGTLGSVPDDPLPDGTRPMDPDTSPTARALLTLEALQNSPGITAERLAARLGVTERAARRYVGILREAGIPVESTRGPYGGYRLGRGVRLPPLTFSQVEALGLVMAVLDGHHDPDSPDPVGTALGKLVRALPRPVAAQVDAVRRSTAPAPDRSAARPDPETTATLVGASADRRRVRITYRSEAGNEWDVDIDPWAVVVRHGRWYVVCWAHRPGDRRAFRVDRVQH